MDSLISEYAVSTWYNFILEQNKTSKWIIIQDKFRKLSDSYEPFWNVIRPNVCKIFKLHQHGIMCSYLFTLYFSWSQQKRILWHKIHTKSFRNRNTTPIHYFFIQFSIVDYCFVVNYASHWRAQRAEGVGGLEPLLSCSKPQKCHF